MTSSAAEKSFRVGSPVHSGRVHTRPAGTQAVTGRLARARVATSTAESTPGPRRLWRKPRSVWLCMAPYGSVWLMALTDDLCQTASEAKAVRCGERYSRHFWE